MLKRRTRSGQLTSQGLQVQMGVEVLPLAAEKTHFEEDPNLQGECRTTHLQRGHEEGR